MEHFTDANQVLPLGVKIGKSGVLSFREFATNSLEAFHKLFTKFGGIEQLRLEDLKLN